MDCLFRLLFLFYYLNGDDWDDGDSDHDKNNNDYGYAIKCKMECWNIKARSLYTQCVSLTP